jgi:hypothetical protein
MQILRIELSTQRGDQLAALIVDGTFAAEMIVMLGNLAQSLGRHIPAARHIFKKRENVFRSLRSSK